MPLESCLTINLELLNLDKKLLKKEILFLWAKQKTDPLESVENTGRNSLDTTLSTINLYVQELFLIIKDNLKLHKEIAKIQNDKSNRESMEFENIELKLALDDNDDDYTRIIQKIMQLYKAYSSSQNVRNIKGF